jgi:amino acid adenylation domain-containing protein
MKTIDQFLAYLYSLDVKLWLEDNRTSSPEQVRLRCSAPEEVLTPDLNAQLQARKAEIVAFLKQASLARHAASHSIQPTPRVGNLPVSFAQQRLWFLEQLQPGSSVYNIPTAVRLTGSLNRAVLTQALNAIVQRHETLRTNFIIDEQLVQMIAPSRAIAPQHINLCQLDPEEQNTQVLSLATQEAQKPFDLAQDSLLRVTLLELNETEHVILLTMHHIISDGWSMEVLVRELAALYAAFSVGQPSPLATLPIQYADFAVWQRQWLQGEVLEAQLSYWKQQLGKTLPVLQLPTDFPRLRVQSFRGETASFTLSSDLSNKLKAIAKAEGATLFMILLAAFKVLLYRYTGQAEIIVGSPIANRNRAEVEGLIGFFVNTLVLRTDLSFNPTFQEVLRRVRQVTWDAYDHQDLPFEKLVEELQPERDLSYNPLFQVKFRLENAPTDILEIPGLTLSSLKQVNPTAKLDLSLDMYETPTGLVGGFEYNRDLFAATTITRMVEHFRTLLEGIANHPTQRISELPLLTRAEQQQILVEWNQTQTEYTQDLCFHQMFANQVERTPDAIALIYKDEQLTYQELNRRSNQLAHYLQKLGVSPEVRVGICLDRSSAQIIAMLGVLKAGGAYVPLDPAYPKERLAFMLEDAQLSVLIQNTFVGSPRVEIVRQNTFVGRQNSQFRIPNSQFLTLINFDADWQAIAQASELNPTSDVKTNNLAYLIYTSGSTGVPKGVLVTHEGLVNLTEDKIRVCDVHPDSCVLQLFSFSFDASIPEIIMALGSGAKLCLAPLEDLLPGLPLLQLLREKAVSHITITPSALSALPAEDLPALRMVLVGGEAPSPELIARWSQGRRFINAYGPTEVTVNASMVQCGNGNPLLPVLRPSANKQLYVLDAHLQPVAIGVIGELHIGGIGLARGYLHRPDLTALKFIPNPFVNLELGSRKSESQNSQLKILYKTGDLACYLPDGSIKLFGRIDNQVKVRGFRIEPGEIEALLNQHPDIQISVVIVREDIPEDKRLVAYIVWNEELGSDNSELPTSTLGLPTSELRRFLKEKLPDYMVPSIFITLDALPLTPNGKVDHKSLPVPEQFRSSAEGKFVAPRTPTERKLVEIFTNVLEVESVGVEDNFFDLGGHSLLATRLITQLLQAFQVELTVIDLFEAPSVAELAIRVEKMQIIQQLETPVVDFAEEREEIEL